MHTPEKTLELIKAGTARITPEDALLKKLKKGVPLTVKLGADPTSPDLHLGHAVVLSKLRQFQDLGHRVVFLIGDFTAQIGDPTGKSKTRPPLSIDDIQKNMISYFQQVGKVLDPAQISIRYNSEWLSRLSPADIIQLCGKVTVARLIEREDFATRLKEHISIGLHELLYPIMQGYDSVVLDADIEIGGTDQTFNVLMGRFLQEQYAKEPQVAVLMPLLEGLDGVQKMSKSLGNTVGLAEPASQAFGKLMSLSDELMWRYYSLLLLMTDEEIESKKSAVKAGALHPMDCKKAMAHGIIARFWSADEADAARAHFEDVFQKNDYSKVAEASLGAGTAQSLWIVELLKLLHAVSTSSEAKRLIESRAVSIDGQVVADFKAEIPWRSGMLVKVGKHRIYRIK